MFASFIVDPESAKQFTFYQPKGCLHCNGTGFKGRVALHELLVVNDAIREAILSHQTSTQLRLIAREQANLISMREDGFYKATQGVTTLEEIIRVVFHHESDTVAPRTVGQVIALCEGREPPAWPQGLLEKSPHKVIDRASLENVPVQVFTDDTASAALEGESYRVRFDANTVESETERIADFIIDTVKRLRTSEGAEFAEFSLYVRDKTDRIFVETLLPPKNPPLPRSSRETGMRQVGYLK
jgi:hypothetical protein